MKRILWVGGILTILSWPFSTWAQIGEDYNLEIAGRYWKPRLDSAIKIVESGIGNEFKLVDDLGFDKEKDTGEGRLQIKFLRKHKFNFSFLPLKWEGDKIISRTIEFSGKTYTAGTRVQSKLDLNLFKVGYEYDFLTGKYGFLGAALDVLIGNVAIELKAPELAIHEKEEVTAPIPMIGLIGRLYPIKWLNFTVKVSGLPVGSYGHILDAEASLHINPVKYVGISGGYRYFEIRGKYNDNSVDFRLDGSFAALMIRF